MEIFWLALMVASWSLFTVIVVWLATTTRRIHPDVALLLRAVVALLLAAGVIFLFLAG